MELLLPASVLPSANTTPPGIDKPGTSGFNPSAYFNQFGMPSPAGHALGAAFALVVEPKYWMAHASGKPPCTETPVKSAIEARSNPTANGTLWIPKLPSL